MSTNTQKVMKIENKIIKLSLLFFLITTIVLVVLDIYRSSYDLTSGFLIGFVASFIMFKFSVYAIDQTIYQKNAIWLRLSMFIKLIFFGAALAIGGYFEFINLWTVFASLFIMKLSATIVGLNPKN